MRYKGDYSPSYLADPEEYTWVPLEKCKLLLEKYRYACFVHPEHSIEGPAADQGTILLIISCNPVLTCAAY